jgi:hypothetical protein
MSVELTEEQLSRRKAPAQLTAEREYFRRKHVEFRQEHLYSYVLICRQKDYGFFDTSEEAEAAAYANPEIGLDVSFLVQQIFETPDGHFDTYNLMNIAELAAND